MSVINSSNAIEDRFKMYKKMVIQSCKINCDIQNWVQHWIPVENNEQIE